MTAGGMLISSRLGSVMRAGRSTVRSFVRKAWQESREGGRGGASDGEERLLMSPTPKTTAQTP